MRLKICDIMQVNYLRNALMKGVCRTFEIQPNYFLKKL